MNKTNYIIKYMSLQIDTIFKIKYSNLMNFAKD